MWVKDKKLKARVFVADAECLKKKCYHPHYCPSSFVVGRGYLSKDSEWMCITRENFGCPKDMR